MFKCSIVTPQQSTDYNNIKSITVPALSGQMQILTGHAESFIFFKDGNIIINEASKKSHIIQVQAGECYVKDDIVNIIL